VSNRKILPGLALMQQISHDGRIIQGKHTEIQVNVGMAEQWAFT